MNQQTTQAASNTQRPFGTKSNSIFVNFLNKPIVWKSLLGFCVLTLTIYAGRAIYGTYVHHSLPAVNLTRPSEQVKPAMAASTPVEAASSATASSAVPQSESQNQVASPPVEVASTPANQGTAAVAAGAASAPVAKQMAASASSPVTVASSPVTAESGPAGAKQAEKVVPVQVTASPTNSEDHDQLIAMNFKLDRLIEELDATKKMVIALKAHPPIKPVAPKPVAKQQVNDDLIAVTVVDINTRGVVLSDSKKEYKIAPGEKLPGGATFIGFDPVARVMKTDRGDIPIK